MSKLGQKSSIGALSSSEGNICEVCTKEVDEELKEIMMKDKRKRITKKACKSCFQDYMGRSTKITITMPNSYMIWLDDYVKESRANGVDVDISKAIRRGLDLLKSV